MCLYIFFFFSCGDSKGHIGSEFLPLSGISTIAGGESFTLFQGRNFLQIYLDCLISSWVFPRIGNPLVPPLLYEIG